MPESQDFTAPGGAALDNLGVRLHDGVATLRVWSRNASSIELVTFDETDLDWVTDEVDLERGSDDVWEVTTDLLPPGTRYAIRVGGPHGPGNTFNPETLLLDPYAKGLAQGDGYEEWRSVVIVDGFDWGDSRKPGIPLDRTVIYEAHLKGMTKRHPDVPPALHGTYAGLAHPTMIEYFHSLGVTSIELLPVHAFVPEPRLLERGLTNYWGYNTLNFFTPHAAYATEDARKEGPEAVLAEFKGMVKLLHEAGLEVILDVVYNHTSEEGIGGPRSSLRGIDNAHYYRQQPDGVYVDTTGCGNTLNTATDAGARLALDSLRYWAQEMQIDGFRFDLAAALGRDENHEFTPEHPLLTAIRDDPALQNVKLIAEPWDVGLGGWQTGNFTAGWQEWNDRYRDRVRNFWLSDIDYARRASAPVGIGGFATRLAGSSNTFSEDRGPLASVNFITAHDGFTLRDLVSYDVKHNEANGEDNRDGADMNRAFNHGVEGPTNDPVIRAARRKAMRNLLGTLLLSAGIPMLTAGDEHGRTQRGNNNAYAHDSDLTWLSWEHEDWQNDLRAHVSTLTRLRRENPALRPSRYARLGEHTPNASVMDWYNQDGETMEQAQWTDPGNRTLQYAAASTPVDEQANRILLVVHGTEAPIDITLPMVEDATRFVSLWSSADEHPDVPSETFSPGDVLATAGTSMRLFRVE
ncbi:glycogen debranching protein GlgX [Microbacterium sp. AK031]|uniref:glycogen debranching protein GlgX n=1 Tax=Microbacterium sp. AK031 TaxID=2723076 RepID=UPI0021678DF8|nr:glycogen debranching protein GlgX [Microbacterium sp. AK031]MCS3842692.1 glycogen operon protein [Microbacterium sp. AK031]